MATSEFAKLFGSGQTQLLIKIDRNEETDEPEVRAFFQPEDLGVCSFAARYTDDDAGWDKAEAWFESLDEAKAREWIKSAQNTALKFGLDRKD